MLGTVQRGGKSDEEIDHELDGLGDIEDATAPAAPMVEMQSSSSGIDSEFDDNEDEKRTMGQLVKEEAKGIAKDVAKQVGRNVVNGVIGGLLRGGKK